jgi:hypothetical protein
MFGKKKHHEDRPKNDFSVDFSIDPVEPVEEQATEDDGYYGSEQERQDAERIVSNWITILKWAVDIARDPEK